jgi:signal transduction histidine kinase
VLPVAAAVLPVAALAASPRLDLVLPGGLYVGIHSFIEVAVVAACVATFAVQWYASEAQTGDARGRFVGAAFLGVAFLEAAHLLAFPGMTAFGEGSTGRGIWYWLGARLWTVFALLLSAFVGSQAGRWYLRRRWLLVLVLGSVGALIGFELAHPAASELFFVPGQGLTPLKRGLELLVMAVAAAAALVHYREHLRTGAPTPQRVAAALGLTVLSELCFTLYASPYDLFNLLGHVYLVLAFALIFDALFVAALLRPYVDLRATSRDLAASNAELARLRHHVEHELEITIARLKETRQLQDDLVRAVTHDVRTPLQVIMLQATRLQRLASPSLPVAKCADTILESTRRITTMMRDLVDATQLERGAVQLSIQRVRIGELVTGLLAASAGVIDPARIRLDIPAELPPVPADPSRLERIFANLIGNAVKYSDPATPISVTAALGPQGYEIAVSDRGPGIAPEELPRIFDRFYRGRSASGDGLGLGLHIVRQLARAHGGEVQAESRVGVGSTFTVRLPAEGAARAEPERVTA